MTMQEPDPFTEAIKRAEQRLIARYRNVYQQIQAAFSVQELNETAQRLYGQIRTRSINGTVRALQGFYKGRLTELCTEMNYTLVTHSPTLNSEQHLIVQESKNRHNAIARLKYRVERHLANLQAAEPDEQIFGDMALWYQRYQRWILWWQVVDRLGWEQVHPEGDQWEEAHSADDQGEGGEPGGRR